MKFFHWFFSFLVTIILVASIMVAMTGLNYVRVRLNEIGHHHNLQAR